MRLGDQPDYPVACLATTTHPGTFWTLRQALTFRPFTFAGINTNGTIDSSPSLLTNFFTGVGTNGWEFEPPAKDFATFKQQIEDPTSSLRIGLQNLANFAGDHQTIGGSLKSGAFPPTPNDTVIHPYPALSMWGDYSNLKRALSNLGTSFDNLSVADKTYVQTAACTLGMLAHNIDQIQKFDPSAISGTDAPNDKKVNISGNPRRLMARLAQDLYTLMDGINDGTAGNNSEVLPRDQLSTYKTPPGYRGSEYSLQDYQNVPPEAFIGALRQYLLSTRTSPKPAGQALTPDDPDFIDEMRMAEMIMLNHQIRRDRTFGFKPSPRFGQYSIRTPGASKIESLPAACDPDQFVFTSGSQGDVDLIDDGSGSLVSKGSTVLGSTGLTPAPSSDLPAPNDSVTINTKLLLSRYRLALSRLCGTIDSSDSTKVLPKFPALYYLFPEVAHDYDGSNDASLTYDHIQPTAEPYIADFYIQSINAQSQSGTLPFQPTNSTRAGGRAGFASLPFSPLSPPEQFSRKPDSGAVFPVPDLQVGSIKVDPRPLAQWQLPKLDSPRPYNTATAQTADDKANFSPNRILTGTDTLTEVAVPFLDRAFFNGRQLMLNRTLDIDLGMLRSTRFGAKNDVWLPKSGIVYAFREDAVREDAISRPPCTGTSCKMSLQNPASPVDPRVRPANPADPTRTTLNAGENGISTKAIDEYPDPDRRIHGFRLRNGVQVKRGPNMEGTGAAISTADNVKGLSFFTDQPVYIQGEFNLHQTGTNDNAMGTILEEFDTTKPNQALTANFSNFYQRTQLDAKFAKPDEDRWRPSEILADSISILSNNFCDGSIADTFLQYKNVFIPLAFGTTVARYPVPDTTMLDMSAIDRASTNRSYYHLVKGLFDPGCVTANYTSFHNQNRPAQSLNSGKTAGTANGWDWVRENSRYDATANRRPNDGGADSTGHWVDITSPVKISRAGQPLIVRPRDTSASVGDPSSNQPRPPIPYNVAFSDKPYYNFGTNINNGSSASFGSDSTRYGTLVNALATRINTIIVSGINPSRPGQGYGGLHNFPRFLESWTGNDLSFSGSLIQLSYTNYATAPFELENLEPWSSSRLQSNPSNENIMYYEAPNRRWGYDVALQFSPAGPAAARFVTSSKNRTEYYVEPPASDPYIVNLCEAAKAPPLSLSTNCPKKE